MENQTTGYCPFSQFGKVRLLTRWVGQQSFRCQTLGISPCHSFILSFFHPTILSSCHFFILSSCLNLRPWDLILWRQNKMNTSFWCSGGNWHIFYASSFEWMMGAGGVKNWGSFRALCLPFIVAFRPFLAPDCRVQGCYYIQTLSYNTLQYVSATKTTASYNF